MSLNMDSFAAALKQHYTSDRVENLVYADHPLLAMLPKYTKMRGINTPVPIIYANPQGRSAGFARAKANKGSSQVKAFLLTRAKDYSLVSIDNETMEASEGDSNAFMEAATLETDGGFASAARSLAIACYRDGSGFIGTVGDKSGSTITLDDPEAVTSFEDGQVLNFYASDRTTLRGSSYRPSIVAIDRDTGVITLDGSVDSSVQKTDLIVTDGDFGLKVKGLAAWIPTSAPSSAPFFGVDRTADPVRLAGVRHDGRGQPIDEALIDLASKIGKNGGKPTHCFVSFLKFAQLEKTLGAKKQYVNSKVGDIGFTGLIVHGPKGDIEVYPDQDCQGNLAWMLTMSVWKLYSIGDAPKFLMYEGNKMLRESDADAVESRIGYYAQIGCRAPGWNGVCQLD